ncbi:hypothetical protein RIF29_16228 [Crotalaria pallida]|uniref:Importin N-terminal domain-containing protein n=1 Tax=Crotalaria pallida TaxID=3830 RepID=A0AAN9FGW2_CROPI
MANVVVDQDQQWLLNCLSATLDPNPDVRNFAEASLNQASLQPGFGSALSKVAANKELAVGLRQISFSIMITYLFQFIFQNLNISFHTLLIFLKERNTIRDPIFH